MARTSPPGNNRRNGKISSHFVRKVFIALLLAGFFALFVYAIKFFMLVFAGILVGVFFSAIAGFITSRTGIPRRFSLLISIVVVLAIIISAITFLTPIFYEQADEIVNAMQASATKIKTRLAEKPGGDKLISVINDAEKGFDNPDSLWSRFKGVFSTTLGVLADVLIILITGLFLAADPKIYLSGFVRLFTPSYRKRVQEILDLCYRNLRLWLIGKFASMSILFVLFFSGLMILGVPLAFALALISALLSFIPNIGAYIGGIIAVMVGFTQGIDMALYVLILYVIVQLLEDYFFMPVINKKMIALPPALTLFWLVLLGISAGLLGLFMAEALLSIVLILVRELYVRDYLEKSRSPKSTRWRSVN